MSETVDANPDSRRGKHDPQLLGVNLRTRWDECTPALHALAQGLEAELSPLLHGAHLPLPTRAARLTRAGGRCSHDGTPLTFDPWRPREHECPTCARTFTGIDHDDWWAMGAQLWVAERTLHAALLGTLRERNDLLALAAGAIDQISELWPQYPNEDNALGPTRPFFSTYLESVWLLNLCLAASLLRDRDESRSSIDRFISAVVEPDRALIASFPEGSSNRQTWHTAAQLAAARLLGDTNAAEQLIDGPLGVQTLIADGLLDDGSWYEGENYHLFAHRGLWYGVSMLEAAGAELTVDLARRFNAGFATPLMGILPDDTFPSRRDSRYKVSVHQWRFAEWCELGLARNDDPVLRSWLHRLYNSELPRGDTGRSRSTADIERDEPACALSRSDLGWRTLLCARAAAWTAPAQSVAASVVLPSQGLAVLRSDSGRIYIALESGHPGGGHGHPDRLGLTIQDGDVRILDDPGAGSYVERSLHWYRSTLAHNAPLIDQRSQASVPARLLAFDVSAQGGWIRADASGLAPDVRVLRTVVLHNTHVVDHLQWWSPNAITVDLPIHVSETTDGELEWTAGDPSGEKGLEDGFAFLEQVECAGLQARSWHVFRKRDASARAWYCMSETGTLWRAIAPGPPRTAPRLFHWLRMRQSHGEMLGVWSLRNNVEAPLLVGHGGLLPVQLKELDDTTILHTPVDNRWCIELTWREAHTSISLSGARQTPRNVRRKSIVPAPVRQIISIRDSHAPLVVQLGASNYRGAEETWTQAGSPTAEVSLSSDSGALDVLVEAHTGPITVPAANAENPFDNERADVNADGLQIYIGPEDATAWSAAWLIVPTTQDADARITPLVHGSQPPRVWCESTESGWKMRIRIPRSVVPHDSEGTFRFDLIVNERPPHRMRRRGQLVLSGSRGEFVYLRGDRHDPARALRLQFAAPRSSDSTHAPSA